MRGEERRGREDDVNYFDFFALPSTYCICINLINGNNTYTWIIMLLSSNLNQCSQNSIDSSNWPIGPQQTPHTHTHTHTQNGAPGPQGVSDENRQKLA